MLGAGFNANFYGPLVGVVSVYLNGQNPIVTIVVRFKICSCSAFPLL
jgi:hypothetical protein